MKCTILAYMSSRFLMLFAGVVPMPGRSMYIRWRPDVLVKIGSKSNCSAFADICQPWMIRTGRPEPISWADRVGSMALLG